MASSTTLSLAPADYAGWRVCSDDGQLGFVERLQLDGATGEPTFLAVRAGRIIVLLVPVEEIETVDADESLIVLGPNSSRLVPELHGDELVLRPARRARPARCRRLSIARGRWALALDKHAFVSLDLP